MKLSEISIAVIGLGYVGLPLAVEFGKSRKVVGFDTDSLRIDALLKGHDATLEVSSDQIIDSTNLIFSNDVNDIRESNVYIVTVPTPIDNNNSPDLSPLIKASEMLASVLKKDDIVIYESTVYPGATEEVCIPVLEKGSHLKYNLDFYAGYSP